MYDINAALQNSLEAFNLYQESTPAERAQFLRSIASGLEEHAADLIRIAASETNLEEPRLQVELKRTIFQLTSYGAACEDGRWLEIRIDTGDPNRQPPKPDLRKMMIPLGPVAVFGASNFPFAYSTAGGDTACALAAGCTVLLKAHPAHASTSHRVAGIIQEAAKKCKVPQGVFIHVTGEGFETGTALVQHPLLKAVAFTGSFEGGRALFDLANKRPVPIPVFAEMGSVNPVFLLPGKVKMDAEGIARMLAQSITLSGGQFCTNPGLLIGINDLSLDTFHKSLSSKISSTKPVKMLHTGIAEQFHKKRASVLSQPGVESSVVSETESKADETIPTLATVAATAFLENPLLHKEVFGPFSLLVLCRDMEELNRVAHSLEGQLTATLIATDEELEANPVLVKALRSSCGRLILNGVSTGVEVALAMQHGGPYPATTDSRFTAVGADGIRRFCRPVCYQNWQHALLPPELQNENPLQLSRTINNILTREPVQNFQISGS